MGKSTPSDSKRAAKSLSDFIKVLGKRIATLLEHDLVLSSSMQSYPGLVSHFKHFSTASGLDSLIAYADELAQAAFFHFLSAKCLGTHPTNARFLPGLDPLLDTLYHDPAVQLELVKYSVDQFTDEFHEAFLKGHDPGTKKRRGVFYTPIQAVQFMVRGVDEVIKSQLGVSMGLADDNVKIIDPACGTGAFLMETCKMLVSQDPTRVKRHLLKDIEGHDIMLSALVFCEMQIARLLAGAGIKLLGDEAANLRQGNSLLHDPDAPPADAGDVVVMLGNPPYSVSSANKNGFITSLMADYKVGLKERNIQPLSDDYVKFLRMAQWRVERAHQGIVAFVTNNAYIYKMIYRRMRECLLTAFDDIYIVNLHGNVNIGEKTPAGDPDGNIFEIRVGTCIVFMVKSGAGNGHHVHYHEIFGNREAKFEFLERAALASVPFDTVSPVAPGFFFVKKDMQQEAEYEKHPSLKDVFKYFTIGVKTHRDDFVVELDHDSLASKVNHLASDVPDEEIRARYGLKDTASTIAGYRARLRKDGIQDECFITYLYRPFDHRVLYFSPSIITRHRLRVMQHLYHHDNIALVTTRLLSTADFCHSLVTREVGDIGLLSSRTSESAYFFPLYLYGGPTGKVANIKDDFMTFLTVRYPGTSITPDMVLGYIYAILHTTWYKDRYSEPLKNDFPRIPMARDADTFMRVAATGSTLVKIHISWSIDAKVGTRFRSQGETVERIDYDATASRVTINDHHQIKDISPESWAFKIGNYQVLQKWLRGRKDTRLTPDDEARFVRIARVIGEALAIVKTIDSEFPLHRFDVAP